MPFLDSIHCTHVEIKAYLLLMGSRNLECHAWMWPCQRIAAEPLREGNSHSPAHRNVTDMTLKGNLIGTASFKWYIQFDPAIPLLGIWLTYILTCVLRDACVKAAALL